MDNQKPKSETPTAAHGMPSCGGKLPIARHRRIEIIALCDSALDSASRLSLLGTYEDIIVAALPFVMPSMTIALRLRFWPDEPLEHSFQLQICGPDGESLFRSDTLSFFLRPNDEDRSAAYNLIVNLGQFSFSQPGEHSVDFSLDGELEGQLPFKVSEHSRSENEGF